MTTTETIKLNVLEKAHNYAKIYASLLSEEFQRKRAYASIVALYSLVEALEKTDVNIQKSMTLFRNPKLNEQYEIADLYVNNWHVDVRVITDGDGVLIPKLHFESNLLADFYAVVKVDKTLQNAELLGFVEGAKIEANPFDNNYNSVLLSSLITYGEFLLKVSYEKDDDLKEEDHEFFQNSYLALMDDEIDATTRNKLLSHMFNCNECRTEFCCFTGFEMVSCNAAKYDDILTDKTLEVIGANAVEDEKYEGKEETIYFEENEQKSLENQSVATNSETTEETVSDILDELFSINEMTSEPEIEEKTVETKIESPTIADVEPIQNVESKVSEIEEIQEIDEDIMNTPPLTYIEEKDETPKNITIEEDSNLIQTISENIEIIENEVQDDINLIDETKANASIEMEQVQAPDLEIQEQTDDAYFDEQLTVVEDNELEIHKDDDEIHELIVEETEEEIANLTIVEEQKEEENELEFHKDVEIDEYKEHNAEPAPQSSQENVQKVIVDYDENGEPIYSYVNGVENINTTSDDEDSPLTIIDDSEEIQNEKFETFEPDNEKITSNVDNDEDKSIQYIQNEDDILIDENEVISRDLEDIKDTDDELDDVNDVDDVEIKNVEEEENISITSDIEGDILVSDDEDENSEYDEEEYEDDDSANDEDNNDEYDEEYDDEEEYEDDDYEDDDETEASGKKNGLLVGLLIVVLLIVGGGFGAFFLLKDKFGNKPETPSQENNVQENQMMGLEIPNNDMFEIPQNQQPNPEENNQEQQEVQGELLIADNNQEQIPPPPEPQREENPVPPLTEADLLPAVNNEPISDPNQAIANAFANNGKAITVKNINWLCTRELFADKTFNNYLQKLDNILKLNLRKNILDATEKPKNNTVSVKLAVDNMGNLLRVMVSDSSGSNVIDDIVLRSINETFETEKSQILNDGALKADKYYLKVVIKL